MGFFTKKGRKTPSGSSHLSIVGEEINGDLFSETVRSALMNGQLTLTGDELGQLFQQIDDDARKMYRFAQNYGWTDERLAAACQAFIETCHIKQIPVPSISAMIREIREIAKQQEEQPPQGDA